MDRTLNPYRAYGEGTVLLCFHCPYAMRRFAHKYFCMRIRGAIFTNLQTNFANHANENIHGNIYSIFHN